MSKPKKSNGLVNAAIEKICLGDFNHPKQQVDQWVSGNNLKQCTLTTLCLMQYCYMTRFKISNHEIQKHLEIKAWQSESYRRFCGHRNRNRSFLDIDERQAISILNGTHSVAEADDAVVEAALDEIIFIQDRDDTDLDHEAEAVFSADGAEDVIDTDGTTDEPPLALPVEAAQKIADWQSDQQQI